MLIFFLTFYNPFVNFALFCDLDNPNSFVQKVALILSPPHPIKRGRFLHIHHSFSNSHVAGFCFGLCGIEDVVWKDLVQLESMKEKRSNSFNVQ
jgi:hypothetical protein